ncbi:GTP pyrophosphokinase [Clostridia bacterium]|nr:GTP pyrophosphokinase [Clostridia bacterium]
MGEIMIHYQDFDELMDLIRRSGRDFDTEKIKKAYNLALEAHGDQRRVSGVPYILHPTSVACILVDLGMDSESVIAALLHDVVEDTDISLDQIKKDFGADIAHLINGVTKLKKIPYSNREVQQAENIRKMLIAMSDDIRVIIIKLADRLHNMRTIECMKPQKRRDKSLENMEVYAPIAHRLGIRALKEELEDLSLRYLDPVGYNEIEHALALSEGERTRFINEIKKSILERSGGTIPDIYLEGRVKSINGIYRKTYMRGKTIEQIYDIFAVRVIVGTVTDCYNVLGIIHDLFQPLPNRFKDYISTPKSNMYQSLHTTVIGKEGIPFEVQIRTREMHYTSEYGIAAHWKYKVGSSKEDSLTSKIAWIRQMLENQFDDETDILKNIKTDLAAEDVFVFTPKGDVISLPQGSTVIDMAYAIHTAVGNRMIGAKVDGKISPIDHKVNTGEIIEIITTKESKGPNRAWLNLVKTSEARGKIRQWFKKEKREENILEGKAEVEREFKRNSIIIPDKDIESFVAEILRKQFTTLDDFYASLGYGGMQLAKLMPRMKEEYAKKYKAYEVKPEVKIQEAIPKTKVSGSVIIEGVDDCLVKFSKCCNPLPGDNIIGFITRGFGVSIHKQSCNNVPVDIKNSEDPQRWVKAHWAEDAKESYQTSIVINASDRTGLLADIAGQLSSMHIFIHNMNSREKKDGTVIMHISVTVSSMEQLRGLINRLSMIDGIISITRN